MESLTLKSVVHPSCRAVPGRSPPGSHCPSQGLDFSQGGKCDPALLTQLVDCLRQPASLSLAESTPRAEYNHQIISPSLKPRDLAAAVIFLASAPWNQSRCCSGAVGVQRISRRDHNPRRSSSDFHGPSRATERGTFPLRYTA